MKNYIYLFLIFIVFAQGCKSKNKNINPFARTSANTAQLNANKIIDYTNTVSEVIETYTNAAADAIKDYDEAEKNWNEGGNFVGAFAHEMGFLQQIKPKAIIVYAKPIKELEKDYPFFEDSVSAYKTLFTEFNKNDSLLKLYIAAQDYKEDKYKKGKEILYKQYDLYPQIERLYNAIQAKIHTVAEAAEEVSQKDSPLKDAYKACKTNLNQLETLVKTIKEKKAYNDADIVKIEGLYNQLKTSTEENKIANKSVLENSNKQILYNSYYDRLVVEINTLKGVVRNISTTKNLSNFDYENSLQSYDNVVKMYNIWIQ